MKKLLGIVVLGLLWCNISVAGGIKFDHFKKFRDDPSMKLYIMGLLDGTSWTNVYSEVKYNKEIFCTPENLILEASNAFRIIETEAEKLFLESTFPCK